MDEKMLNSFEVACLVKLMLRLFLMFEMDAYSYVENTTSSRVLIRSLHGSVGILPDRLFVIRSFTSMSPYFLERISIFNVAVAPTYGITYIQA